MGYRRLFIMRKDLKLNLHIKLVKILVYRG